MDIDFIFWNYLFYFLLLFSGAFYTTHTMWARARHWLLGCVWKFSHLSHLPSRMPGACKIFLIRACCLVLGTFGNSDKDRRRNICCNYYQQTHATLVSSYAHPNDIQVLISFYFRFYILAFFYLYLAAKYLFFYY